MKIHSYCGEENGYVNNDCNMKELISDKCKLNIKKRNQIIGLFAILVVLIVQYMLGRSFIKDNFASFNVDATYHATMMVQCMMDHPLSNHKLLPIMNYNHDPDRNTPWGACLPNKQGNIFYFSFPPAYVVVPAAVFKVLKISPTVKNLQYFALTLSLLTTILLYLLLNQVFQTYSHQWLISITGVLIYVFSVEAINASYEYWAQMLFQPILIAFVLVRIKLEDTFPSDGKFLTGRIIFYSTLYCILGFLMVTTEWASVPVIAGIAGYESICFIYHKNERKKYAFLFILAVTGAVIAFLTVAINILSMFEFNTIKQYLQVRKSARTDVSLYPLFTSYIHSLGLYSIIVPVLLLLFLIIGSNNRKNSLLAFSLLMFIFALMENYIVMNHAINYSYDRLKFVLICAVVTCGISGQILEHLKKRKVCFITLVACSAAMLLYGAYRNYIFLKSELTIKTLFYNRVWECHKMIRDSILPHIKDIHPNKICYVARIHHRANINLIFKRNFLVSNKQQARNLLLKSSRISKIIFINNTFINNTYVGRDFHLINDISILYKDSGKVIETNFSGRSFMSNSGYFKKYCGFFVPLTPENRAKFSGRAFVILPDGTTRKILKAQGYLHYLYVFTEGDCFSFDVKPHDLMTSFSPVFVYYITDKNWIRGYYRHNGGFFVPPYPVNIAKFKVGRSVILPDGTARKIISTTRNIHYLNVYTEGKPFCPGVKPHELVVK